jgi:hypothetical protein
MLCHSHSLPYTLYVLSIVALWQKREKMSMSGPMTASRLLPVTTWAKCPESGTAFPRSFTRFLAGYCSAWFFLYPHRQIEPQASIWPIDIPTLSG